MSYFRETISCETNIAHPSPCPSCYLESSHRGKSFKNVLWIGIEMISHPPVYNLYEVILIHLPMTKTKTRSFSEVKLFCSKNEVSCVGMLSSPLLSISSLRPSDQGAQLGPSG